MFIYILLLFITFCNKKVAVPAPTDIEINYIGPILKNSQNNNKPLDGKTTLQQILYESGSKGSYAYLVYIITSSTCINSSNDCKKSICAGTIIHNSWILTAAHCIFKSQAPFTIVLGDIENTDWVVKMANVFYIHSNFSLPYFMNDIALIKLPDPIEFTESIKSISFPKDQKAMDEYFKQSNSMLLGWKEEKIDKRIVFTSEKLCLKQDNSNHEIILAYKCYDSVPMCYKHSGGPLIIEDIKRGKMYHTLIGIASYEPKMCIKQRTLAFSNILNYYGWISSITGLQF